MNPLPKKKRDVTRLEWSQAFDLYQACYLQKFQEVNKKLKKIYKLRRQELPIWGGGKKEKKIGARVPNSFKNFRSAMRIPNMCLVLKLDNGQVVSIADEQNHRQTE